MYSAYQLDKDTRQILLRSFPPKYNRVVADHVTVVFGDSVLPKPIHTAEIIGIADDNNGLEILIVKIDKELIRPDGGFYHLTWSLNPNKHTLPEIDDSPNQTYKPVHSNMLIKKVLDKSGHILQSAPENWTVRLFETPVVFHPYPIVRCSSAEIKKQKGKQGR